jgi:hypothetical protein
MKLQLRLTPSPAFISPILCGLFLLATGGAWAWYHVAPKQFPVSYRFTPTHTIPGWSFQSEPISRDATELLATTNLFNGTFISRSGRKVTAFMGTWDAGNPKQLAVVSHSPDVCWVGAGWKPVAVDHPEKVFIDFGNHTIPFEVRTFEAPGGGHRELTLWCTLVSGQIYEESGRFLIRKEDESLPTQSLKAAGARHSLRTKLVKAIVDRIPGDGTKQFVRFSIPLRGDWQSALEDLQNFARDWLQLQRDGEGTNPDGSKPDARG